MLRDEIKKPAVGAAGSDTEGLVTVSKYAPIEMIPQLIAKYNGTVRAINAAEIERPQSSACGGVAFAFRPGSLLIDGDDGVEYRLSIHPNWDMWAAPGFSREGFQRNSLEAGDVLTEVTA